MITFESDFFRALVFFTCSRWTPVHGDGVMVNGIRHQQKIAEILLTNLIVGIKC